MNDMQKATTILALGHMVQELHMAGVIDLSMEQMMTIVKSIRKVPQKFQVDDPQVLADNALSALEEFVNTTEFAEEQH